MTRKAVETGALWKPWKNGDIKQTTLGVEFFHRSHNAWETSPDGVSHRFHRFYDEIHPPKNETPRLQKCNLCARCAREKLLPMNRELQKGGQNDPGFGNPGLKYGIPSGFTYSLVLEPGQGESLTRRLPLAASLEGPITEVAARPLASRILTWTFETPSERTALLRFAPSR